jgi:hypothetical protein
MTPVEECFNREMEGASRMKHARKDYWGGYSTGLMRGFFGSMAVDDDRHETWIDFATAGDKASGYRDGYRAIAKVSSGGR